jgi:hypothetical protein
MGVLVLTLRGQAAVTAAIAQNIGSGHLFIELRVVKHYKIFLESATRQRNTGLRLLLWQAVN